MPAPSTHAGRKPRKKPATRSHMFMIRMNAEEYAEAVRRRDQVDPRMYLAEYARRAMLGLLPGNKSSL